MDDLRSEGVNSETAARLTERIRETYREMIEAHGDWINEKEKE